ncbi:PREDICTED: aspartyl/asparaginyl beta-hydroxylase-like isoform X4 [Poecilia mexicana]|uniref:Aspartyl beta-hydroxylase/Triadin domain-containing protein n=1 Tax=Poecilia mexicana TaxID=48701 RepID=A0A3B3WN64_9TELE|nr:PREDICTED: aspartyl/asparaginyl beta-hydroxylase-like isoform X4 [Poecilia mexicana]
MGDPANLVESITPPVVTAIPAGEMQDAGKSLLSSKNGKKPDSGSSSSSSSSFFTWFIVLALLGVWTSVAVVYFDLVDYQGVLGKLAAYDTDGDGDFDVEDAKVLLDDKPAEGPCRGVNKESPSPRDVGLKLREALKQQLAIIHERVEAKKMAKLALAEVRQLLAKEEEEKELDLGRKEITARVKERVASRLKEEEEKMEKEEMEKALEKVQKEKAKQKEEKEEETKDKEGEKKSKKREEKVLGNEGKNEEKVKLTLKEKWKKIRAEKSVKGGKK